MSPAAPRVLCFATQGPGSGDERRIEQLLAPLNPEVLPFPRGRRLRSAAWLLHSIRALDPDIVVMEGTGIGGGAVLLVLRVLEGRPYIVSSGDAVGPFLSALSTPLGLLGALYERALCRLSSGFIGWSPYLVGRALTFGAPRAMTAPHWSDARAPTHGAAVRERLGIPPDALVFGIVGSLNWSRRYNYCYGLELVRAALAVDRPDLRVLVVGDGDGRQRLRELAGPRLGSSILSPGAVPQAEVGDYLAAMDVASLPQSVDRVGSFRYTTKISEYLAAEVPIVTGQIPLAYDLDEGFVWRLPGDAPWDERYISAMASLMGSLDRREIAERRPRAPHSLLFDRERQVRETREFVVDAFEREQVRDGLRRRWRRGPDQGGARSARADRPA